MMAVMTFNAYITIALVIGGCIGYWIFGSTLVDLNMQRFYRKQAIVECDKNCEGIFKNYTMYYINLRLKTTLASILLS